MAFWRHSSTFHSCRLESFPAVFTCGNIADKLLVWTARTCDGVADLRKDKEGEPFFFNWWYSKMEHELDLTFDIVSAEAVDDKAVQSKTYLLELKHKKRAIWKLWTFASTSAASPEYHLCLFKFSPLPLPSLPLLNITSGSSEYYLCLFNFLSLLLPPSAYKPLPKGFSLFPSLILQTTISHHNQHLVYVIFTNISIFASITNSLIPIIVNTLTTRSSP